MKIREIKLKNFRGIESLTENLPQIVAICARNGAGKTTLLNAIRFALTGEEPDGDVIRYGSNSASVSISLIDEDGVAREVTRIKERGKPSKFKIDGVATTQKALNDVIQEITGLEIDKIKVLSSQQVVESMKPAEFSSLILEYIPEKLTLEDVVKFMPSTTPGMLDVIDANLPEDGIDLSTIEEFDAVIRECRKADKESLKAKELMYDKHIKEAPVQTRAEVLEKIKVLKDIESAKAATATKRKAFEALVESRAKAIENINSIKKEADSIVAARPDSVKRDELLVKKSEAENKLISQRTALNGIDAAVNTLSSTLEAIESSVCPISPLITCKTDKSVAKADIEETIKATEESREIIEKEIISLEKEVEDINAALAKETENAALYDKKITLLKQAKAMEDTLPPEPVKPEEIEVKDADEAEAELFKLEAILKNIEDYEEGLRLKASIDSLKVRVDDLEALVKMFSDRGPVKTGVVSSYLSIFESICNKRSEKIRPEITFSFEADKAGVVVRMNDSTKGTSLTIDELSGGEKAYLIYIIIDMLNALIGAKILMLDELSVLDATAFGTLLDLVMRNKDDYDHIILSCVDHKELKEGFVSREIPLLDI